MSMELVDLNPFGLVLDWSILFILRLLPDRFSLPKRQAIIFRYNNRTLIIIIVFSICFCISQTLGNGLDVLRYLIKRTGQHPNTGPVGNIHEDYQC